MRFHIITMARFRNGAADRTLSIKPFPNNGFRKPFGSSPSTVLFEIGSPPGSQTGWGKTAEGACGGNRWDVTFLDTFRYLDQLGRLARAGVQVVMHNTLAASDYGLLDEGTFRPRPNYWAALLWHRVMGTIVLGANSVATPDLHIYAHCHPGMRGVVTVLAIN